MSDKDVTPSKEFELARRATYLKINLDRILENLKRVKSRCAAHTEIMCVLKGNAYGHGAVKVAKCLQDHGYDHFAVATALEGEQLRSAGVRGYIQVFGNANSVDIPVLYNSQLTPTVADTNFLSAWSKCFKRNAENNAKDTDCRPGQVVIKIDSGMCRNGCQPQDLPSIVQMCENNGIPIHSMMTQFSKGWDDMAFTQTQLDTFMESVTPYRERGMKLHVASSGAILNSMGTDLDFVRPGVAMYGQAQATPLSLQLTQELGLKPAIEWRAMTTLVKDVEKDSLVGYDAAYRCTSAATIAMVPIGYGDGYKRQNYCKGHLTTSDGVKCPVIGKICMDAITLRLPEATQTSREFTVMSADFNDVNSCYAISRNCDSLENEILSNLSVRLPRLYELAGQLTN